MENPNIINLKYFLEESILNKSMTIETPKEDELISFLTKPKHQWKVKINDDFFTSSLRLVGSYVPEKIALIGFNTIAKRKKLSTCISELSNQVKLYQPKTFCKRVMRIRFQSLIQSILFEEIFYRKDFQNRYSNRILVTKEKNELVYYQLHNSFELIKSLANRIQVSSEFIPSKSKTKIALKFSV